MTGKAFAVAESVVEQVARAIAGWTPNVTSWADACDDPKQAEAVKAVYHTRARAAIAAMPRPIEDDTPTVTGEGVEQAASLIARQVMSDSFKLLVDECSDESNGALMIREGIRRYAAAHPTPSDGLLSELVEVLERIADLGSDGEHSGDRHARCRAIARTALAKAKAGEGERRG